MKRDPMTKQRSAWEEDPAEPERMRADMRKQGLSQDVIDAGLEADVRFYRRNVHDGQLTCMVGTIPNAGLHLSISHRRRTKEGVVPGRYPTWDEIADARDLLLPADKSFHMTLPRTDGDEYISVHKTTFHLHEDMPEGVVSLLGFNWHVEIEMHDDMPYTDEHGCPHARLVPYDFEIPADAEAVADA